MHTDPCLRRADGALPRPSTLHFMHEQFVVPGLAGHAVLDVQPLEFLCGSRWVALTAAGRLLRLDLDDRRLIPLACLAGAGPAAAQLLAAAPVLRLAEDGRQAAVLSGNGEHGVVIDLDTGQLEARLEGPAAVRRWLPAGPAVGRIDTIPDAEGLLSLLGHHVSYGPQGTCVRDGRTGELLLRVPALRPLRYHRGARHFLTLSPPGAPAGAVMISRLEE